MKTQICFYFQVHQPYRIKPNYSFFDMGMGHSFVDEKTNRDIMQKVSQKCYIPANNIFLKLMEKYPEQVKITFSLSGTAIEQMKQYSPQALISFQKLANSGQVEFLSETYYHSLSSIYSKNEFIDQIEMHKTIIRNTFLASPSIYRNTELIYNNQLAQEIHELGYRGIIIDGIERALTWRSPNFIYSPEHIDTLRLLLKNYNLSDDLAFRYPYLLKDHPDIFINKLKQLHRNRAQIIGLFMDYETFGEHHWPESGILQFLENLIETLIKEPDFELIHPSQAINQLVSLGELDIPETISWADTERDLSAWTGNPMQKSALELLYSMESEIKNKNDETLLRNWRILTSSDHSYYLCLKNYSDGAVHNYFSPFSSPHEAFVAYSNALNSLKYQLN